MSINCSGSNNFSTNFCCTEHYCSVGLYIFYIAAVQIVSCAVQCSLTAGVNAFLSRLVSQSWREGPALQLKLWYKGLGT